MGWKITDKFLVDPQDNDSVPFDQGGIVRRSTWGKIKDYILGNASLVTTDKTVRGAINEVNTSLSERVKRSTADITYYVSPTGNDSNDGLTSGTAFKTIQHAIDSLPQIMNNIATINVASGTYNEVVIISGFAGKGSIKLNGGTNLNTAVNYIINNLSILKCTCNVTVVGFISAITNGNSFYISGCVNAVLNYCIDTVLAISKQGIFCEYSFVIIYGCQISNKDHGIFASNSATIFSNSNTGTGNTYGLYANNAATIGKYGTQPSGTTAEASSGGGVIR
ncbi:hypothetical protein OD350_24955 [Clostridium beijerinckii]|uniref:DUF1565 domain-containing protein n=1 Tax=Clostridium beijerinckii TaxID=1520 RepID=A0AAX0B4M3_CLOBE|nr:hypothetical protein [Clostridium beijerinckii]NRT90169.1 hypothetical protein [Clostridium beijerinckii]NYC69699.1 hypothetical protein [Clostridium beijerinckii]UYZ35422.1 hypothetical protein OD350_24955 [Clostridium beijerinckii]